MRPRHVAAVALVLSLTLAGFFVARTVTQRDARDDSEHRAEVAAAQIRDRIEQGVSLTASLSRFMFDAGGTGVTTSQFASNSFRWLNPAEFPAAAWAEQVRSADRAEYERRLGQAIVLPNAAHTPAPRRRSYLPATLVSGFQPLDLRGVDLRREPGVADALRQAMSPGGVSSTPLTRGSGHAAGMFLVAAAPDLIDGLLRPGAITVFVPESTLLASTGNPQGLRLISSTGAAGAKTVRKDFFAAGRGFAVVMPTGRVTGPAGAVPWIILAGGLVLTVLVGGLGVNAGRRAKAQTELDRIFTLSPDLIAVADFDGHFTRVNPAVERIFGYAPEEFLAKPYLEFVHPDDRQRTAEEAAAIARGARTVAFGNRYIHKDGSVRAIEWTSTPVVDDRLIYSVARDVTRRRHAETEVERLADEQAALRRIATLVAQEAPQTDVFAAIAHECGRLFGTSDVGLVRFDGDTQVALVSSGALQIAFPVGSRLPLGGNNAASRVFETGASARVDDYGSATGAVAERAREVHIRSAVGCPIVIEGKLWGAIVVGTTAEGQLPRDTETRLGGFTDLMGTALSNATARAEVERLAVEQAALRRVAELVARAAPLTEVFATVADEVTKVMTDVDFGLWRDEGDETAILVAISGHGPAREAFQVGAVQEIGGDSALGRATRERQPVRVDDYTGLTSAAAETARELGVRSSVACPVIVGDRVWGYSHVVNYVAEPLPAVTEARLKQFSDLVSTAIGNAQARAEVEQLAEEQAALRRVAELVAREAPQEQVFLRVAQEIRNVVGPADCAVFRDEGDGTATVVAVTGRTLSSGVQPGARFPLDGDGVIATVIRRGRTYRVDDTAAASGAIVERAQRMGMRSAVGCPVMVRGRVWGAVGAGRYEPDAFPADTETRLERFARLVATAIGNAQARDAVERLADEQAALGRVATLVAEGASPTQVFDAVTAEMSSVFGSDGVLLTRFEGSAEITYVAHRGPDAELVPVGTRLPHEPESVSGKVWGTRAPARMEGYFESHGAMGEVARTLGMRKAVGAPILVEGLLWGVAIAYWQSEQTLRGDIEERMVKFTDLVATAIANTESRTGLTRLADEQAGLRRVATLVAATAAPTDVFHAVAEEVGQLLGVDSAFLTRFDDEDNATVVSSWRATGEPLQVPRQLPARPASQLIREIFAPARITPSPVDPDLRELVGDKRSTVAAPITVKGSVWGFITVAQMGDRLPPPDTEARLGDFTELVAMAVANTESREAVEQLADEQAALQRVATLVAQGTEAEKLFAAVTKEFAGLFPGVPAFTPSIIRFDPGPEFVLVGSSAREVEPPLGSRWAPTQVFASTRVYETGCSAYVDATELESESGPDAEYLRRLGFLYQAGSPIVVEGRLWGALTINSGLPLPPDTERRLERFTELIATAVANAESREALSRLADEQAALRRVATLVAEGARPREIFGAVIEEVGSLIGADNTTLSRYEDDREATVLAHRGPAAEHVPPDARIQLDGNSVHNLVRQTGRPARIQQWEDAHGQIARIAHEAGVRASVGTPVIVEGRLWGVIVASWNTIESPPSDIEARMAKFADLLDTAIANADARDQLAASRVRLLTEADDARRRVVRDLHDGAQQRLVHSIITLKLAQRALRGSNGEVTALVEEALAQVEQGNIELRELAHGILPPVLTHGGLRAGIDTVVARSALPVEADVTDERFPAEIEASAYYIVAEALTNVVKHAHAKRAAIKVRVEDGTLRVEVVDDGVGGADLSGHGLVGLSDRATALGGMFAVGTSPGGGTTVVATFPLE